MTSHTQHSQQQPRRVPDLQSQFKPDAWLPTSRKEMDSRGWDCADVILFSGDAYVDHPSFGAAVIGRVLEARGYRVAIVPQPNWRDDLRDFKKLGRPRLFFGVSGGCMDSMVNHYTANKRLRSDDAYTADGRAGQRPDYAVTVYSKILKQLWPDVPVVLGGIEASLRRFAHYDYWADALKPGVLMESGADLLVYGLGEKPIVEIAERLARGERAGELRDVRQTARVERGMNCEQESSATEIRALHSFAECVANRRKFAENFRVIEEESNRVRAATIVEPMGGGDERAIVANPPWPSLTTAETDASFDLPYTRLPHPRYRGKRIPAYEMIRHSITMHRGCFGGCSFCTISAHQGKFISERTEASILREVENVARMPDFAGNISDLGGPSANMYGLRGKDESICAQCRRASCLHPRVCRNLNTDLSRLTALYRKVLEHPKVKRAFVGSGIRYDIFLDENGFRSKDGGEYFGQLVRHHVSGRLKVAPEHSAPQVLGHIRKPSFKLFEVFKAAFDELNEREGLREQLVPYFISSLPYCEERDMRALQGDLKRLGFRLEQVQDFTPTPMTLDSAIYYSGFDPYTGTPAYVARTPEEKLKQRSYFFDARKQGPAWKRPGAKRR
ncbi:YgiQ family radical SAM protein [Ereboglobus luteus]|uniref:YgiQ family radical SAM protein n=1 Tax=Ereboglobus luteus TaxID=1796921 RepID=A0A2U8E719_9BACT|nr:YgiQ family radical SAM protein [Ereboglobus luteus]AWI10342.1 YgiQ family radical SAM protein [Ereboglobus luteus]